MALSVYKYEYEDISRKLAHYSQYNYQKLYGESEARVLSGQISSYVDRPSYSEEEKKQASSQILWKLREYIPTPFQRDALSLLDCVHKQLKLDDRNKEDFLNFMVSSKSHQRFSTSCYRFFSNYKIETDYDKLQNEKILYKIEKHLSNKKLDNDAYKKKALKFLPFMQNYAKECPKVNNTLIDTYSRIFLQMSTRFDIGEISFMPYLDLLTRTESLKQNNVQMGNLFGEEKISKPQIDKKAVSRILGHYADWTLSRQDKYPFNMSLHNKMMNMMSHIIINYDYKFQDASALNKQINRPDDGHHLQGLGKAIMETYKSTVETPRAKMKPLRPFTATKQNHWEA